MINWKQGYESAWRIMHVNPKTWTDDKNMGNVASVSISHDGTDDVPLLETADLEYDGDFEDGWYRIEMLANQNGSTELVKLGTFRFTASSNTYYGNNRHTVSASGVSALHPAKDMKCRIGEFVGRGEDGARYILKMLKKALPGPIRILGDSTFIIDEYQVFDASTPYITAVWNILDKAGWCLQINGLGEVIVRPMPTEASFILNRDLYCIVQPEFDKDYNLTDIPNVYRVIDGDKEVEVINDDPSSVISTVSRGYRIEEVDTSPQLVDGETLYNYARRMLVDKSSIISKWSYRREYIPDVYPFSKIIADRKDIGFTGNATVLSQSITCDKGITVDETVGIEVSNYVTNYVELSSS